MRLWMAVMLASIAGVAAAADTALPWKFTVGEYAYSTYLGADANLRWRRDGTDAWVGVYRDKDFGTQARMGSDTVIQVAKYLQLQPSLQVATRGFVGGSLNVQVGDAWYALAGLGRTDAKSYFNLNFDPNDALTLGAGHQAADGMAFVLFVVADNRFHTGQRDWHLNARVPHGDGHVTLDLLRKSGLSDVGMIRAWGFSAGYDWPRWFLRATYDPYQNFSAQSAWRFASGVRF